MRNLGIERINSILLEAAAKGDVSYIRLALLYGADVNYCDENGLTSLHYACFGAKIEIVRCLIPAGANVNVEHSRFGAPILLAILKGEVRIVDLLLQNGADINAITGALGSPLHAACIVGKVDLIQTLLDSGANTYLSCYVGIGIAQDIRNGKNLATISTSLYRKFTTCHPLYLAALFNRYDIAQTLLGSGADVNAAPNALFIAVKYGHPAVIQTLLTHGADVMMHDSNGYTALHWTVFYADSSTTRSLIDARSDVNAKAVGGVTPLMLAAREGQLHIVMHLVESGADDALVDDRGFAAYAFAMERGHEDVAAYLLALATNASSGSQSTRAFSSNDGTSMTSFTIGHSEQKEQTLDETDRLTIRSQTSLLSLNLEENEEQYLIAIFVQELLRAVQQRLGCIPDVEVDNNILSAYLRSYAELMKRTVQASTRFERGAIDFVRSRRRYVRISLLSICYSITVD